MGNWIVGGLIIISVAAGFVALSGSGLETKVRACLEDHSRKYSGGLDHVYLTEALGQEIWRSYPDGTATRIVTYRLQGSNEVKTTTCLW